MRKESAVANATIIKPAATANCRRMSFHVRSLRDIIGTYDWDDSLHLTV